ncbi:MAG: hypothetical protein A2751_01280 [Candidatus Doudnabacteria bacterium RIFCSPHIGHO2_01_FULL_46_14]|uniref:THIF-type NAD/FAD binding fold domain-containing protein n=1 Tax=Candidatus Doudnabacteria bacterium RIFCSPHIGHO2_01_FULL_46_14 TaxID=1817824 RepID=A0A1F5NN58_9BACT|nr:MAG: hypothetical protein A2751_01280 [Candidatus Doudnabacteria bacterium RIFCSPHIGHO2_01_FULL_46_14]
MNILETKPTILNPLHKNDFKTLQKLKRKNTVVDHHKEQLRELFLVRHPKLKFDPKSANLGIDSTDKGRWVYFPWNRHLVHLLSPREYFELRTARNKNLITEKEQKAFQKYKIGIAGLSVGNSAALDMVLEGAEILRLADFDTLSLSNLNRIRAGAHNLGENKTMISAKQIYELNPYSKLTLFPNGVGKDVERFTFGLDVIVDEIDDVYMKIKLRLAAKKSKIPVVSAADNGDNSIVDVERFDLEPKRPIFHGMLGKTDLTMIKNYDFRQRLKLINKMVGLKYVTKRMKESLAVVGKKIYSWPQLGGAASLSGSAVAYAVRRIALGHTMKSGKYNISLDRVFGNKN